MTQSETTGAADWLALHVYYAARPQPLLAECVAPLVDELTAEGLLAGHFFINYWLEGPHVRLRLRPSSPAVAEEVRRRAEARVTAFLRRRPALYSVEGGFLFELYNTLFDLELDDVERDAHTGPDGRMRVRPNNSVARMPYEPEYGKYGGPAGVALAEWHFQRSSELVLDAVRSLNLHLRTVTLGTAAQLMMTMAATFVPSADALAAYLDDYRRFWHRTFAGTDLVGEEDYASHYDDSPGLPERFALVREAVAEGRADRLPRFLAAWASHSAELRDRADDLARRGDLVFASWDGLREERLTDPVEARIRLLSPYLHMTNNRLHITIRDEAYLASLLGRSLRASTPSVDSSASAGALR